MTVEKIRRFTATCQYAMVVKPPEEKDAPGKRYYRTRGLEIWFEVDTNYILGLMIGQGSYGTVCTSWNTKTLEMVAIKKISSIFRSNLDAMFTLREIKILTLLKHPNIVTLKDVMLPPTKSYFNELYLVYQFMNSNLHRLIVFPGWPRFCNQSKYILFQILLAVRYMHSANVIHRDLKPENILVNADLHVRICDFGSARTCREDGGGMKEECVGTQWYRSPEILFCCDSYGPPADMWSVGCIFAEILGKVPIFMGNSEMDQICEILRLLGTQEKDDLRFIKDYEKRRMFDGMVVKGNPGLKMVYRGADPLAIDLLEKMLVFNPEKRITATQALEHPFLVDMFKPEKNPVAETRLDFNMEEEKMCDLKSLRAQLWKAVVHFHPDIHY